MIGALMFLLPARCTDKMGNEVSVEVEHAKPASAPRPGMFQMHGGFVRFLPQSSVGIVTTCGRFSRYAAPGLVLFVPVVQNLVEVCTKSRIQRMTLQVKTVDNVFANVGIAVQWRVLPDGAAHAYFNSVNLASQISAHVDNCVRSCVSSTDLDGLFKVQHEIAEKLERILKHDMAKYGICIEHTLVEDIDPDETVKASMNSINASQRRRIAASNDAEAEYVKVVRAAEAERERMRLRGEGISHQREAIMSGYKRSVEEMRAQTGMSPMQVCEFVRQLQHMDVMETIGRAPTAKTLFLNANASKECVDYTLANESKHD